MTIRAMVIGVGMAAPVGLGVAPAMAINPNFSTTPAASTASGTSAHELGSVCTYKAPPADGGAAPGSSAAGGQPGYVTNKCHDVVPRN